jgi:hypothetical protein
VSGVILRHSTTRINSDLDVVGVIVSIGRVMALKVKPQATNRIQDYAPAKITLGEF